MRGRSAFLQLALHLKARNSFLAQGVENDDLVKHCRRLFGRTILGRVGWTEVDWLVGGPRIRIHPHRSG